MKEQVLEKRDPDLNEEEDIRMEDSRREYLRYVVEDDKDKRKTHSLRWDVYTRKKKELTKRDFLVSIMHAKGGDIVWTCVKDNINEEKDQYKVIGLRDFDHELFEEEEGGGIQKALDRYTYEVRSTINFLTSYISYFAGNSREKKCNYS